MRRSTRLARRLGALTVTVVAATGMAPQRDQGAERLWLLAGLALSLTAAGVVAVAAARGRDRRND